MFTPSATCFCVRFRDVLSSFRRSENDTVTPPKEFFALVLTVKRLCDTLAVDSQMTVNIEREEGMNKLLQSRREASGKTQARVAKEAGINLQQYQNYEYDKREPGARTAIRIADALGVTDLREIFPMSAATDTTRIAEG